MSNKNNDELQRQASENTLGLNPVIGIRRKDLLSSARTVLRQAVRQPLHSAKHVAHFGLELKNVLLGKSSLAPESDDRRFNDPAWSNNPLYRRYLQTYLAWRKELQDWIGNSDLPPQDISRGQFVINLMTEAMAPTNTLSNPAAVKRFFETGGKSLLDGLSNLAKDMVNNGGMPSQVNMEAFEVGKNLGTSEGAVVFRNDVLELIQYSPITEQVHARPLLVVPPQINKFYVFDLSPEKSLARYCLRSQQQTFIISWRNPTKAQREWGLSTYIDALKEAVDAVLAITGSKDLNMLGACSGGITCTALVGHYAAIGENKVNALTLLVSVLDTTMDNQVALFVDEQTLEAAKRHSYQAGVLEGSEMAKVFAWMRPNDLIWNYWVNNYLLGNEPPVFDILFWNNDTTRLPAAFHGDLIEMFKSNPLIRPDALEVCGTPIDLKNVHCDIFSVAGTADHITPWQSCYRSAHLFGGKIEFVLSNSGHIQSILNPPGNPKARFMTGADRPGDPVAWQENATKHADSWWLHWQSLAERTRRGAEKSTYPPGQPRLCRWRSRPGHLRSRALSCAAVAAMRAPRHFFHDRVERMPEPYIFRTVELDDQSIRTAVRPGKPHLTPLLIFNGIGANLELVFPFIEALDPDLEVIAFDVPGVGGSSTPRHPYRFPGLAKLTARMLDYLDYGQVSAIGVSWGGALAQQFAHDYPERCKKLVLAATAAGAVMVPGKPKVLWMMASPRRYVQPSHVIRIAPLIYGGAFRRDPDLAMHHASKVRSGGKLGYYWQLFAGLGWTSIHWLHKIHQPTLVLAGDDDPLIPLINMRLLAWRIPNAQLHIIDDGHLFLITRAEAVAPIIMKFLQEERQRAVMHPRPASGG
ncbi:Putative aminoacrylate hydrolase RutD [Pseudomonas sp. MM223]|nr:Putative aminoacrylate hydrolase RutD [Pseudomonas sp. MM223]